MLCGIYTIHKSLKTAVQGRPSRILPYAANDGASGLISTISRFQTMGLRFAPRFVACRALSEASSQNGYQACICYQQPSRQFHVSLPNFEPISNPTIDFSISGVPRTIIDGNDENVQFKFSYCPTPGAVWRPRVHSFLAHCPSWKRPAVPM